MDVRLDNPDLEAKVNRWVSETGRSADELVEDAMVGYFDEIEQTKAMLDRRYDAIKSGRVQPIDGEEAFAKLREKSEARRKSQA